jgi:hypothetical protein
MVVDYENQFCQTKVNRSSKLKCSSCKKHLPMKTEVVFELGLVNAFIAVYCMDCVEKDNELNEILWDQRHPFDLDCDDD